MWLIHWLEHLSAVGWSAIAEGASGVATAVGVIVALWLGASDRRARRQAEEREHAEQIAAWMAPPRLDDSLGAGAVIISNASMQPVYDLAAVLVFRSGAAPHTGLDWGDNRQTMISLIGQVPPGRFLQGLDMPDSFPMGTGSVGVVRVEIAFTDRSGQRHWLRKAGGELQQLDQDAVDYYQLGRPTRIRELGRAVRSDEA